MTEDDTTMTNSTNHVRAVVARGALIVLEGIDRSGKSTQAQLIVNSLKARACSAQLMKFPNRQGTVGQTIDAFLKEKVHMNGRVAHLLYSADRWDAAPSMIDLISKGTTLIVDRYAYSGVVYSAAKGLPLDWCKQPDVGLPRPDRVLYFDLNPEVVSKRNGFGEERFERLTFQRKVYEQYRELLRDETTCTTIDANRSVEEIHAEIQRIVDSVIEAAKKQPLRKLWISSDYRKNPTQLAEDSAADCMVEL